MKKISGISLALVALAIGLTQQCVADAVVDWNVIASQTIFAVGAPARPGGSAGLDFAIVNAAIYDAVEAFDRRFEPYAVAIHRASGSPAAAAARAAHDVLVNR
ncbi:MAG TPA: hypothetical protein VNT76_19550, partial [Candidatus Binatus sp.]|nr:hypothetical protein [Candidatus Binatus sp.]